MPSLSKNQKNSGSSLKESGARPLFIILCLGIWLHAASSMLAATTIPQAVTEIGGANLIGWAFSLYQLGSIVAGAATGMLVVVFGLRYGLIGAAILYSIGCVISAMASNMTIMLLGRLLQGIGGGSILALAYVSINRLFPQDLIPKLIALISVVWSISAFCGPLIGGSLATIGLWRYAYLAFAGQAAAFVLAVFFLVKNPVEKEKKPSINIPFIRLSMIGGAILLISFAGAKFHILFSPLLCLGGFILFKGFLWLDSNNASHRMFPKYAFDLKTPQGIGLLLFFTISMSSMSFLVYGPFLLNVLYGITLLSAGYMVASGSVAWGFSAIIFSRFHKHSEKWLIRVGTLLITAGIVGFATAIPADQLWLVFIWSLCQGTGFGMMWGFVVHRILAETPKSEQDRASSAIPTTQQIGFAVGAATTGIVANAVGFGENISLATAQSAGFWIFAAYIPLLIFANILAWKLSD